MLHTLNLIVQCANLLVEFLAYIRDKLHNCVKRSTKPRLHRLESLIEDLEKSVFAFHDLVRLGVKSRYVDSTRRLCCCRNANESLKHVNYHLKRLTSYHDFLENSGFYADLMLKRNSFHPEDQVRDLIDKCGICTRNPSEDMMSVFLRGIRDTKRVVHMLTA